MLERRGVSALLQRVPAIAMLHRGSDVSGSVGNMV